MAPELAPLAGRAAVELESASSDMDTSLAELRSPLEGRRIDEALRTRAAELAPTGDPYISVRGSAPELPPLVAAHVYRIACEAITNALRHADATAIVVQLLDGDQNGELTVTVRDNGRVLPTGPGHAATGLHAMENRAATIGAALHLSTPEQGAGTLVELRVPVNAHRGGAR